MHPPINRALSRFVWFPLKQSCCQLKMGPYKTSAWPISFVGGGSTCLHLEAESEQTHAADVDGCLGIESYAYPP